METKFLASTLADVFVIKKLLPALICLICQDHEETEEIWSFWNPILWTFEYCILSHNISFCVVCEHFCAS